jgi:hypothetical protein
MTLPAAIPKKLRAIAIELPGLEEGEAAWGPQDALAVIESLRGTAVAIARVLPFGQAPGGYAPASDVWFAERRHGESDPDYAARSQEGAKAFIEERPEQTGVLFALSFPMWKDAA